jgi:hypothetical protein
MGNVALATTSAKGPLNWSSEIPLKSPSWMVSFIRKIRRSLHRRGGFWMTDNRSKGRIAGLHGGLLAMAAWAFSTALMVDAPAATSDAPAADKPAASTVGEHKRLLAKQDQSKQEATALIAQRKYAEAMAAAAKSLALARSLFGEISPQSAEVLELIAKADERREDWLSAIQAREKVLAIRIQKFGKEHWQTFDAQRALDLTATLRQLNPLRRKHLWEADDRADALSQLERQGKLQEAVALAQQAVEARKAVLGNEHWRTAAGLYQLGRLDSLCGTWPEARAVEEESLAIRRQALGENHPDVANSLNNLGGVQWQLGDYAAAKASQEKSLAIRRKILPADDPYIAMSLNNLGASQLALGDDDSARKNFEELLAIRRKNLPKDHPDIATSLSNLGVAQRELNDLMREFYTNLWQRKLEALCRAQLAMLKRYDPEENKLRGLDLPEADSPVSRRGSPFYWAGFILSGDWR